MNKSGGRFVASSSKLSSDQIKAHGDVKTRIAIIWLVGIICGILSVGGLLAFYFKPENSKDIWVIIGPIISATLSGTVAFLAGEKSVSKNA